jgi:thiamine pyrophosphokinase
MKKQLGVIFTGGESPQPVLIRQVLKGKNAFFAAADSGLLIAEASGKRPDCIIGDMDSLPASRLETYPPECVIRHELGQEYTDTELAMQKVVEKGCREIWIIGGGGGRMDHLFAIRSLFEREAYPCRWITAFNDIYCINAEAEKDRLSLKLKGGALVSVFPLGDGRWEASSSGLKWPLEGLPWDRSFFGLSNIAVSGDFSITAKQGRFLVVLQIR